MVDAHVNEGWLQVEFPIFMWWCKHWTFNTFCLTNVIVIYVFCVIICELEHDSLV